MEMVELAFQWRTSDRGLLNGGAHVKKARPTVRWFPSHRNGSGLERRQADTPEGKAKRKGTDRRRAR